MFSVNVYGPILKNAKTNDRMKAGCPRTARNTISEVNKQISEACTGVARRVEICQTSSGVKDSYTQHWIEMTINQSRTMRKSRPTAAINEIKDELNKWLGGQSNIMYNPFLELKGQYRDP